MATVFQWTDFIQVRLKYKSYLACILQYFPDFETLHTGASFKWDVVLAMYIAFSLVTLS